MTIAEKLAICARTTDDLERLRWCLIALLNDVEREIEAQRPGYSIDRLLGDTPVNLEEEAFVR